MEGASVSRKVHLHRRCYLLVYFYRMAPGELYLYLAFLRFARYSRPQPSLFEGGNLRGAPHKYRKMRGIRVHTRWFPDKLVGPSAGMGPWRPLVRHVSRGPPVGSGQIAWALGISFVTVCHRGSSFYGFLRPVMGAFCGKETFARVESRI